MREQLPVHNLAIYYPEGSVPAARGASHPGTCQHSGLSTLDPELRTSHRTPSETIASDVSGTMHKRLPIELGLPRVLK